MITYQLRYFGFDQNIPEVAEALDLPGMSFEEAIFLVEEAADPDKIVCITSTQDAFCRTMAAVAPMGITETVELEILHCEPEPSPRAVLHIGDRAGTL